jgi:osmotically-inducible protein OsmY
VLPDVSDRIRKSLDQAGLKDVTVSQDRDKGVVTLAGNVAADGDKAQAESIDKNIEKNPDAALLKNRLQKGVRYSVKRGVVTLTGEVSSQSKRAQVKK